MAARIQAVENLSDPEFWRQRLGLLPVPLRASSGQSHNEFPPQFVLLNGNVGNFCLQTEGDISLTQAQSDAWSTDVGHHVLISGNHLRVTRWGSGSASSSYVPRYLISDVVDRLDDFHKYLERNEPNRDQSIVAHATRVLRILRGYLPEDTPSAVTVRAFLALLHEALAQHNDGIGGFEVPAGVAERPGAAVSQAEWQTLLDELIEERPLTQLQPYTDLMLRHASGTLFQELHYATQIPLNRSLPGIVPAPLRPSKKRTSAESGVFFTPSAIARTLVEEALADLGNALPDRLRIFDPACGSGEFLKEAVRQLTLRGYTGTVELIGWDIMDSASVMAKFALAFETARPLPFKSTYQIKPCDALTEPTWPAAVDVVLMNPPFASLMSLSEEQKEVIRKLLGARTTRPNLAAAFLLRASQCVRPGGILASVLPASVLTSDSSGPVRQQVATEFTPRLLAKLGSMTAFAGALVDASLYVGKKASDSRPTQLLWADSRPDSMSLALRSLRRQAGSLVSEVVDADNFSLYPADDVARSNLPWGVPRYKAYALARRMGALSRLGDLFNIHQGARLGHDVFIQPKEFVDRLMPQERGLFRQAAINETLADSRLYPDYYVWYPYGNGGPLIKSQTELVEKAPDFSMLLMEHAAALKKRHNMDTSNWWMLMEHRAWQVTRSPKLLTKYFGKAGSVAFDVDGGYVSVVGHAWIPKVASSGHGLRLTQKAAFAYVALCASSIFEQLLQSVSPSVAGGQLSLENRYLKALPMPNLFGDQAGVDDKLVQQLAELGKALSFGKGCNMDALEAAAQEAFQVP